MWTLLQLGALSAVQRMQIMLTAHAHSWYCCACVLTTSHCIRGQIKQLAKKLVSLLAITFERLMIA